MSASKPTAPDSGKPTPATSADNTRAGTPIGLAADDGAVWRYLEFSTPFEELGLPGAPDDLPRAFTKLDNPFEWSPTKKAVILFVTCFSTVMTGFSSGAYTSGMAQMIAKWGVEKLPLMVGVTTYTFGFGFGPMFLAPISEAYGRYPTMMGAFVLFNSKHFPGGRGGAESDW